MYMMSLSKNYSTIKLFINNYVYGMLKKYQTSIDITKFYSVYRFANTHLRRQIFLHPIQSENKKNRDIDIHKQSQEKKMSH